MADKPKDGTDWRLATWEGANLESLRQWASLPLERIIAALEEMERLNDALHRKPDTVVREQPSDYGEPRGDDS